MLDGYVAGEIQPFSVAADPFHFDGGRLPDLRQLFRRPKRPPSDPRARVFIYSHDTFGLGHLRRNLAIAEHLLSRDAPGFDVLLLTGSPVIRSWELPSRLRVQPLPPVVKVAAEQYAPRAGADPFALVKGYREALIVKSVLRERPDFLLVDHSPSGMRGELLPTLSLLRRELPGTRIVLGLRDVLDSPDTVRKLWQEEDVYALLDHAYDDVLVYGSRALFDVGHAYGIPERVAAKLRYVGHIGRKPPAAEADWPCAWPADRPGARVLVTAGGGGDGAFLMSAFLRALARLPAGTVNALVVTGPLMDSAQAAELEREAAGRSDVTFCPATTDLPAMMRDAALVISMAGYNTSVEILAGRKPAILVPRAAPRAEQLMRAETFAKLGLAAVEPPGPELPERLARTIAAMLAGHTPQKPQWNAIDLDGARRVGDLMAAWHMASSAGSRPAQPVLR